MWTSSLSRSFCTSKLFWEEIDPHDSSLTPKTYVEQYGCWMVFLGTSQKSPKKIGEWIPYLRNFYISLQGSSVGLLPPNLLLASGSSWFAATQRRADPTDGVVEGDWIQQLGSSNLAMDNSHTQVLSYISGWWFGTMEFYDFPYIGNVIVPTDSYFSEGLTPPTRYMYIYIL